MAEDFQYDVFLSHSAKDKAVVRPLAERLRKDGLKVWFDEWEVAKAKELQPSAFSLQHLHEEELEHSRVLVLCMSANAFGSDWAQLEADTFRFRDPLNQALIPPGDLHPIIPHRVLATKGAGGPSNHIGTRG